MYSINAEGTAPKLATIDWYNQNNGGKILELGNSHYVFMRLERYPYVAFVGIGEKLTDLTPNTLYHYYLVATNSAGVGISPDMTFTTTGPGPNPQAPIVTLNGPSEITSTNATITGTVNPNGLSTGFFVHWGQTAAYGNLGPVLPVGTQVVV